MKERKKEREKDRKTERQKDRKTDNKKAERERQKESRSCYILCMRLASKEYETNFLIE